MVNQSKNPFCPVYFFQQCLNTEVWQDQKNWKSAAFLQLPPHGTTTSAQKLPHLQWSSWVFIKSQRISLPCTSLEPVTCCYYHTWCHSLTFFSCPIWLLLLWKWSLWNAKHNCCHSGNIFLPLIGPIGFIIALAFLVLVPNLSFFLVFWPGVMLYWTGLKSWVVPTNWNLSLPSRVALIEKNQYFKKITAAFYGKSEWAFFLPARMCHLKCFISHILEIFVF